MNIIAGMMIPETNCAPKLARNSSSFLAWNAASTSRCRPKTLTSSCPVNASSIWPFSSPVCFHWAMNCCCDRLAIWPVTTTDSGTATSATSASSGEIQNIMTSTPTTVSSEVSSWLSVCWRVCEMLSMSLVTRLSSSPRGCLSK